MRRPCLAVVAVILLSGGGLAPASEDAPYLFDQRKHEALQARTR